VGIDRTQASPLLFSGDNATEMADSTGRISGPTVRRAATLLLVVGVGLAGYGVFDDTRHSNAPEETVEVNATVTGVGTERVDLKFVPRVEYTYEYRGQSYTGTNLYAGDFVTPYERRSAAESAVDEYERGATVTAYVDPADPDDAFLEQRSSTAPSTVTGVGVVLALVGAVALLGTFRRT
jgi:hypothetical protein